MEEEEVAVAAEVDEMMDEREQGQEEGEEEEEDEGVDTTNGKKELISVLTKARNQARKQEAFSAKEVELIMWDGSMDARTRSKKMEEAELEKHYFHQQVLQYEKHLYPLRRKQKTMEAEWEKELRDTERRSLAKVARMRAKYEEHKRKMQRQEDDSEEEEEEEKLEAIVRVRR